MRAAPRSFLLTLLAIAVGAGAVVATRSFERSFRAAMTAAIRPWMAADISVRLFQPPDDRQRAALNALAGAQWTVVAEKIGVAVAHDGDRPIMAVIKAADLRFYPFYGGTGLLACHCAPLDSHHALVSRELAAKADVHPGDAILLAGGRFEVAGIMPGEPDRWAEMRFPFERVLVAPDGLSRTTLAANVGGVVRVLLRLNDPQRVGSMVRTLAGIFPEGRIHDFRSPDRELAAGIDEAFAFLSLASVAAALLGGLGVAMAISARIEQRMDSIAAMKALGAGSRQVMAIFLTQSALLAAAGSIAGAALGTIAVLRLPSLFAGWLPVPLPAAVSPVACLEGVAVAIAATVAFTLAPLRAVRNVPPWLVLRRHMPERPATPPRIIRFGSPVVRYALANLFRPANHSRLVVGAVGLGIALTLGVDLLRRSVVRDLVQDAAPRAENLFIIGATRAQCDGIAELLRALPGVKSPARLMPQYPMRLASGGRTWLATVSGDDVVVSPRMARQLHLKSGDRLDLTCYGRRLSLRVAGIAPLPGGIAFRPQLALPPGMLAGLPVLFHGGVRADPARIPAIERALYERFPSVATIDAGELVASAQGLVDTISSMLRLISWFVVASGLLILAAGVVATSSRRAYETAILRLLGATRGKAGAMSAIEFGVLGITAGVVGAALGLALATLALHQLFGLPGMAMSWPAVVAGVGAATLLTAAVGWAAARHTLRGAPLEALREDK